MTRESDYIANMRFAAAVRTPRRKERDDFALIPPEPVRPVSDPVIAAERQAIDAGMRLDASRAVARYVRDNGCTGLDCGPGHDAHREMRDNLLAEVGLTPDPEARGTRSVNGYTKEPERL